MPLFVLDGLSDACALPEVLVFTEDGDILGSSVKVVFGPAEYGGLIMFGRKM